MIAHSLLVIAAGVFAILYILQGKEDIEKAIDVGYTHLIHVYAITFALILIIIGKNVIHLIKELI